MSFSRAPLKRFNENVGCAPPPGAYDVHNNEEHKGPASFQKSERFKPVKTTGPPAMAPPTPNKHVAMSPVRRTMSVDGLIDGSTKKERPGITMEMKQQRLLEKEIRSLVQQRAEQSQRLLSLEDKLKKLEAKLLVAVREKTGLSATVATLERQLAELKKANEFLKNKVSADTTKKRINSLTMELMEARNNLDFKKKEISVLQVNTTGQVNILETDLQAARATVESLMERNKDLEELQQATKTQNEELATESDELRAVIQELRGEIKILQGYLDAANDQVQDLRLKLRQNTELENTVEESQRKAEERLEKELLLSQDALRQKEAESQKCQEELLESMEFLQAMEKRWDNCETELKASRQALTEMEGHAAQANQAAEDCRSTARQQEAELTRLRDVLRRTEKELDERVAHLAGRCLFYEEESSKIQEEGMRRAEELKAELTSLKEVKREDRRRGIQLQHEHSSLAAELENQKALVESLSIQLEHEREASSAQQQQLKEEMEEVLGELALMEAQETIRQGEIDQSLQSLLQEKETLAQQLSQDRTLLDSTKQALSAAQERVKELEAEEERVKEELDRATQNKEEEIEKVKQSLEEQKEMLLASQRAQEKATDEHSRILSEVKTLLAQKDEKIDAMEASHALLREEIELQRREKESALAQQEERGAVADATFRDLLARAEQDRERLRSRLDGSEQDRRALQERVEVLEQEKVTLHWEMVEQSQELKRQLAEAQEKSSSSSEAEVWKKQYEDLYSKVKPFQEQLNSFAVERDALLNENGANQDELNRLADAYARLLGHQNQKQKIKHVVKLKDENFSLKQELTKLRSQLSRQKSDLEQLRWTLPGAQQQQRRFDPTKAFHHDSKENSRPQTPVGLREGNYHL